MHCSYDKINLKNAFVPHHARHDQKYTDLLDYIDKVIVSLITFIYADMFALKKRTLTKTS